MSRLPSDGRTLLIAIAALALMLLPALACGSATQLNHTAAIPEDYYTAEMVDQAIVAPVQATARPGPTPDAMFFENYGVNPFIDTEDDNLSTFAMDVDTGSYTRGAPLYRRWVPAAQGCCACRGIRELFQLRLCTS